MEIGLLQKSALRIKGKSVSFVVNPQDDANSTNAVFLLNSENTYTSNETVVIAGAGEYEIGGVKIAGQRNDTNLLYSMNLEGIEILVGSLKALSAMQHKLKEHYLVLVNCDEGGDASFLTALAVNAVVFYGAQAKEVAEGFEKDKLQQMNKFTTSLGKLSAEMETILLV
ncbi:MAG: hypothetical protein ACR2LN_03010 [Candidatus Levyibacteriota bacterium]